MQRRRAVHAAGLGVIGALVLAGCASGPEPVGQAWEQARTQLDEAETVRVRTEHVSSGQTGPTVVLWDLAGGLDAEDDVTAVGTVPVGEDSRLVVETRTVGEESFARSYTEGDDVPEQVARTYPDASWARLPADQTTEGNELAGLLEHIALPAADALKDADVEPEEIDLPVGDAVRYPVPAEVAESATAEASDETTVRLRSFTVGADGSLVGLEVETPSAVQNYAFSDWNEIEPATVPEEVAE